MRIPLEQLLMRKTTKKTNKQPDLSPDIQTLIELGLLLGSDAGGVTYDYAKSKPTRIQAFIVYLRLMNEDQKLEQYLWHDGDDNLTISTVIRPLSGRDGVCQGASRI
jgi:hypothetical protein